MDDEREEEARRGGLVLLLEGLEVEVEEVESAAGRLQSIGMESRLSLPPWSSGAESEDTGAWLLIVAMLR